MIVTLAFLILKISVSALSVSVLRPLSLNIQSFNDSQTFSPPEVTCWEAKGFGGNLPDTADCLDLARDLPQTAKPGIFHDGYPMNSFSLPFVKTFQSCTVTVSISKPGVEIGNWNLVFETVMQLAKDCSVGRYPIGKSAGVKYIGMRRSIRVTIEKLKLGEGRSTATEGTGVA